MIVILTTISWSVKAQFVHPGGLHTIADLELIKSKVNSKTYPWINGWNFMCADGKASNTYKPGPRTTVGNDVNGIRQRAAKDADAAYYNALRWYVSGDTTYAECAVKIFKAWTDSLNSINPNNVEMPVTGELFMLPITHFMCAAELLRVYKGFDSTTVAFKEFKKTALLRFYPACKGFLGGCGSWSSWEVPALAGVLMIGVFCDRQDIFDYAVNYYKTGSGSGALKNMICTDEGQLPEMGRDLAHAPISLIDATVMSQFAWNATSDRGANRVDLFGLYDNRLLKGWEYVTKYQRYHDINWVPYDGCDNKNFWFPANNYHGRLESVPAYELAYNHFTIIKGLQAPYLRATINLKGLVALSSDDYGQTGLSFNFSDTTTIFTPKPIPATPTNLTAVPGAKSVTLNWTAPEGDVAQGYAVFRSKYAGGPYGQIAKWTDYTKPQYVDTTVVGGTTYYYCVRAVNQSGMSTKNSNEVSVTPGTPTTSLVSGWSKVDLGTVATAGTTTYSAVNNSAYNTFVLKGSGASMFGTSDNCNYTYTKASGDVIFTARLFMGNLNLANKDRVGIMIRDSLIAGARMVALGINDHFRTAVMPSRSTANTSVSWKSGNGFTWLPTWFRLKATSFTSPIQGYKFISYQSNDGATWYAVDSTSIYFFTRNAKNVFTKTFYAGFYASSVSATAGVMATAYFDNFSIQPVGITAVEDVKSEEYELFPNPVNNVLNIRGDIADETKYSIFTETGMKVDAGNVNSIVRSVDVSNLSKGLYFLQLNDGLKVVNKKFFVK